MVRQAGWHRRNPYILSQQICLYLLGLFFFRRFSMIILSKLWRIGA